MAIQVKAAVVGPHRLDMYDATTDEKIGTLNVRPRETAAMSPQDIHASVSFYCELANVMHDPQEFIPFVDGATP